MRTLAPALPFFFYALWLLAVPMEGPLLIIGGASGASLWFLLTHVTTLLLCGKFASTQWLEKPARWGMMLCALLTFALYLYPNMAMALLLLLGTAAAPMTIKSAMALRAAAHPVRTAAWCLVLSNMILAFLHQTPSFAGWPVLYAILPLLTLYRPPPVEHAFQENPPLAWEYLPVVFIFQVVSGLMYAFLFPLYDAFAVIHGVELMFYMLAVLGAVALYRRNRDLLLVAGLALGMAAFGLLQLGETSTINLGMFAMMAAAGCIDLFLLALLLHSSRPVASFGFGLAALTGGIAAGQILSLLLGDRAATVGLAGSMVLNVAALTLFLRHHYGMKKPVVGKPVASAVTIPAELAAQLTERELHVLELVLKGLNFREAAEQLSISESTIKTHMKRIYDKFGVTGRRQLLVLVARQSGDLSHPETTAP